MPRYKFRWVNFPQRLLKGLCSDLELEGVDPADELRHVYGARPTDDFVRDAWPSLRERWLARDGKSRREVVRSVWRRGLGWDEPPANKVAEMEFLRSRNNAKRLREVVLGTFIELGEVDQSGTAATDKLSGNESLVTDRMGSVIRGQEPAEHTATAAMSSGSRSTARMAGTTSRTPRTSQRQKKLEQGKTLEATLWEAADRLRSRVDAAEYKHVVLGLIFLKYVSDVFAKRRDELARLVDDPESDYFMPTDGAKASVLEDRDEYASEGVFWMPEGHRWDDLRKAAKQSDIGERIDAAMDAIERENPSLRGVLPKRYARRELTPAMLGGLIDTFSRKDLAGEEHKGLDVLGRVYEYFLAKFATAEGRLAGEFYTPRSVVRLMVEMLEPFDGRVFDPACGSGGMFVQAEEFVKAHGGRRNDISVFGQEQNPTTWRLAKMNLALRGIEANLGPEWGDSFHHDYHPDLRADFILTNPPFNVSEWGGERLRDDPRWRYGVPPIGNANFAWIQHMLAHLAPTGTMVTVMANGALASRQSGEGEIRRNLVEADLVECIVALPSQLFYTAQIPVCLWFLTRDKSGKARKHRSGIDLRRRRFGEVLFIDARSFGHMVSRTNRELSTEDTARIAGTYHAWRGEDSDLKPYEDVPGFCAAVDLDTICEHQHVLTPGSYVGNEAVEDDGEPVEEKIARLIVEIHGGFAERAELQERVLAALESLSVADSV